MKYSWLIQFLLRRQQREKVDLGNIMHPMKMRLSLGNIIDPHSFFKNFVFMNDFLYSLE